MRNKEMAQLREDLNEAGERIDNLVTALREAEVLGKNRWSIKDKYFYSYRFVTKREQKVNDKINCILNHLGLEFEWVESHYELKAKEEDK